MVQALFFFLFYFFSLCCQAARHWPWAHISTGHLVVLQTWVPLSFTLSQPSIWLYFCLLISAKEQGQISFSKNWTAVPKFPFHHLNPNCFLSLIGLDEVKVIIRTRKEDSDMVFTFEWQSCTLPLAFSISSIKTYQGKTRKQIPSGWQWVLATQWCF